MNTRESVSTEIQTPRSRNRESYHTPDSMLSREFDQFFAKKFPFYRNQYLHPRKLKVLEGFQTSWGINNLVAQQFFYFYFFCSHTVINCSALAPPANGAVSPLSCSSRSTYAQTCSFSCVTAGYVLEGTSSRVCGGDGKWSGKNDTLCRGKYMKLLLWILFP